jgi:hypothetical protein
VNALERGVMAGDGFGDWARVASEAIGLPNPVVEQGRHLRRRLGREAPPGAHERKAAGEEVGLLEAGHELGHLLSGERSRRHRRRQGRYDAEPVELA